MMSDLFNGTLPRTPRRARPLKAPVDPVIQRAALVPPPDELRDRAVTLADALRLMSELPDLSATTQAE